MRYLYYKIATALEKVGFVRCELLVKMNISLQGY